MGEDQGDGGDEEQTRGEEGMFGCSLSRNCVFWLTLCPHQVSWPADWPEEGEPELENLNKVWFRKFDIPNELWVQQGILSRLTKPGR